LAGSGELQPDGPGLLRLGARVLPFFTVRLPGELQLWMEGEVYRFQLGEPERAARGGAAALPPGGTVAAPMPGLVLQVLVRPGDTVAAQARLVVLESMKMELTVA